MTSANQAVVTCYEVLGMSIEQIAEDQGGLDPLSVKCCLLANSKKYRDEQDDLLKGKEKSLATTSGNANGGEEPKPSFLDKHQYARIKEAYYNLALESEVDSVRERAMRNLINEQNGRNDIKNQSPKSNNFNILLINERLEKSRAILEGAITNKKAKEEAVPNNHIDVEGTIVLEDK
jgi:hypothetical protein